MRVLLVFALFAIAAGVAAPAPDRSKLQLGTEPENTKPFIEEVVVHSLLHVRSPSAGRQARTDTQTNLKDGARVAQMKNN